MTDEHLVYVQADTQGVVRLADVRKASTLPAGEGVRLQVVRHGEGTQTVDVRVDEWDAIRTVHTWLRSVASFNRSERGGAPHVVTATQALDRLETLLAQNRLRREHRERLKSPRRPRAAAGHAEASVNGPTTGAREAGRRSGVTRA